MLHIAKLAVGISDIVQLRRVQAVRGLAEPPLRHRTRHAPRRRTEVTEGGSLYWVVAGTMLVRQLVLDIIEDSYEDGSRCAGLVLDPELIQVEGRPVKAFQGWRYLEHTDAPPDLGETADLPGVLPAALRRELRALCLL